MKQSKASKALDKQIEQAYYKLGNEVQINMMDILKLYSESRASVAAGNSVEQAVGDAIAKYRLN